MTTVKDVCKVLEDFAPLSYQESYDNAGLLVGDPQQKVNSVLITLDITEEVVEEAIHKGADLILCHHPLIFGGLKKITGANMVQRCVIKAIKNDIAIYASHTNLDSVNGGVNSRICEKLNLNNCKVLSPVTGQLQKLVMFVPEQHAEKVRNAMFEAGAGAIGDYDNCSFNTNGTGTFRAGQQSQPFVGSVGEQHSESEVKIETIAPKAKMMGVVSRAIQAHPYEEVAYDIYPLENKLNTVGLGMVGELEGSMDEIEFLKKVKDIFKCGAIRYTQLRNKPVKRVAVCGGSGSFLLSKAIGSKADIFISGDFKYHDFFNAEGKIVIADIGHYESEQYTKEVFYELLMKKFPNFALHLSMVNTNPVNHLI